MVITMFKDGDIILIRTNNLFARAGRFFMRWYNKVFHRDARVRYNHAEIYYLGNTYGSRKKGIGKTWASDYYSKHTDYLVLTPVIPYSLKELRRGMVYINSVEGHKYEKFVVFSWPIYIITFGLVKLSKNTDKRSECFEFVARYSNACRSNMFDNELEYTAFDDIYSNTRFNKVIPD